MCNVTAKFVQSTGRINNMIGRRSDVLSINLSEVLQNTILLNKQFGNKMQSRMDLCLQE